MGKRRITQPEEGRRRIPIHKELLTDPRYRSNKEKHIKVKKREQQEKEARQEVQEYKGTGV